MAVIVSCLWRFCSSISSQRTLQVCFTRCLTNENQGNGGGDFDIKLLDILACPLSKKPLRYDPVANELISDELGVAYTILNGIPNLVPSDGRLLSKQKETNGSSKDTT